MTNTVRRTIEQSVLLALLALPVLFSGLGACEIWRARSTLAETQAAAPVDTLVAQLRLAPATIALLGGLVAGGAGLAGLGIVAASARQGARSRPALVTSFHRVSQLLPLLLAAQVIGLALAMLGASVFEASGLWFMDDVDGRTGLLGFMGVVYAGFALWGGYSILRDLRRALHLFEPGPMALGAVAVAVRQAEAPGLFALLQSLARERGTTVPETVTVGVRAGFFVSALPMLLAELPGTEPVVTSGRILHLSLAGLAMLDPMELRTVLAHELAHFSGDDTQYSQLFQPLYTGLGRGAAAMSVRRANWGGTLPDLLLERVVHPHSALAVHAYHRFDVVVAQWSRQRELEADRAAVASGSPAALASSLLRLGLVARANDQVLRRIAGEFDAVPPDGATDLAAELVAHFETGEAGDPAAHLEEHAPHPTDTHPPDRQRIEAAGVPIDDALMAHAARPVVEAEFAAAQALFRDWASLSSGFGAALRDRARQRHLAHREHLVSVAGQAEPEVTPLRESLLWPILFLALLGSFCLVIAAGCILAALYGGEQDRQSWQLLAGIAVAAAIGLGVFVLWAVRLWRGRRDLFMVLSPEGVASPGFAGTLRWLDIRAVSVTALEIAIFLRPEVPLPLRTRRIRRMQHDVGRHALQFWGMLPRGVSAAALQAMLLTPAQAAHARNRLDEAKAPSTG